MASSNIKLFDENKGNMLSDSEFSISNQRMNGLQTGVASSQLQNKAMYQASLVAYAIAQIMMQNGLNANDTDAVSAFVANLSGTMLQKVYDIATTAEAQAGVATGKWMSPALVKAAIDKTLTDKNYLQKSGGTMTGNLILNANPTANLGAATKQYVDTNVNNVKTALTPVFGDLSKNGYFKLGDMSVVTANYIHFEYNDLYDFIDNNFSKLSEIVVLIKNSVWQNTYSSQYNLMMYSGSSETVFASIGNTTATLNMACRLLTNNVTIDSTNVKDYTLYTRSNGSLSFRSNYKSFGVRSGNTNYLKPTSIGTAEIWYK